MMTSIANFYDNFITALLRPFVRVKENRLKLEHTIEMDKQSAHERHIEAILDGQRELAGSIAKISENSNQVLREWLEGFHKIQQQPLAAPPVNNDERLWELEMASLKKDIGSGMTPFDMEQFIGSSLKDL
jgi:exonuclease V gamma subunit